MSNAIWSFSENSSVLEEVGIPIVVELQSKIHVMSLGCVIDEMHAYYQHNIVIKENKRTQQACADFAASTDGAHLWTWQPYCIP